MIDVGLILVVTGTGLALGKVLRLPAWHLLGPLITAAAVQGSGLVPLAGPGWLLATAQLMVGLGLACQMGGTTLTLARKVIAVAITMVTVMLAMGVTVGFALSRITQMGPEALILSFSPGGVAEMGLIALSLNLAPVIVAAHHVYRIGLTVVIAAGGRWYLRAEKEP